ncbi:ThuA domain-containing protein [Sphingopyxis sp.]|jgi:hypothetical protein|uniref:ThuA domain-containing protein n=1 Tax=Sphingopyxis sp. TaxID=1908224 RepID=UPI002DF1A1F4|nr:ThuA domain-containing protein [Sphingopyxis sp.]
MKALLGWKAFAAAVVAIAGAGAVPAAQAAPVTDCPLATASYSADTPLFDLLIDPRAKHLIDEAGILARLPPMIAREEAPSFATIVSLRQVARIFKVDAAVVDGLGGALAKLPLTRAETVARCARYAPDSRTPLTVPADKPALLVFEHSNGFRDAPSVEAAQAALRAMADRRGWSFVFTSNPGDITKANLRRFKAVFWNNVSGDVLTVRQRAALRSYVEDGGGFAAIHGSGGDPLYLWDWYADRLIGARFIGHVDVHQTARIRIDDQASPITAGVSPDWAMLEEWYSFEKSPRGPETRVLLTIDETSYEPTSGMRDLRMGDHPVAWTRCVGRGRSFYSAIGHRPETYSDANNVRLLEQAIAWTMGLTSSDCGQPAGK